MGKVREAQTCCYIIKVHIGIATTMMQVIFPTNQTPHQYLS